MTTIQTSVRCKVHNSFRVQQVAGLFDLSLEKTAQETFEVDVPAIDEDWQIGAIVGPSGSGKSTIARAAFGDAFYTPGQWPREQAVIDSFGELPIKQITHMLTAVGFGSPPSWLKPYHVLSTGERFRCDLAKALLSAQCEVRNAEAIQNTPHSALRTPHLVVFDEFTSVVDRTVAKVASAAVAKAIRKRHVNTRLVVVSCHEDIVPWLAPDWVVDMQTRELMGHSDQRRRLRRPAIKLEIVRAQHKAWGIFARHHYLSGAISRAAQVFLAIWNDTPVAMCAVVAMYGHRNRRRIHRLVTLPDYQGIGIGSRLLDHVAALEQTSGKRVNITSSHPAIIAHCRGSPRWKTVAVRRSGSASRQQKEGTTIRSSRGRATVSFEFVEQAQVKETDHVQEPKSKTSLPHSKSTARTNSQRPGTRRLS